MKRIYICGSHSTGKTTLVRELFRQLGAQFNIVQEAAREVIKSQQVSFSEMSTSICKANRFQHDVLSEHLELHDNALASCDNLKGLIFDRGPDFLAYAAMYTTVAANQFKMKSVQSYLEYLSYINAYVFLLEPHEELLSNDGTRSSLDMRTAIEITAMIRCILELHGIPYTYISDKNLVNRVKLIRATIKE